MRTTTRVDSGSGVWHLVGATRLVSFLSKHGGPDADVMRIQPDQCALTPAKRLIDAGAAVPSLLTRRLMTDALVAFARLPR